MVTYIHETELHKGIEAAMKALNQADIVIGKNQEISERKEELMPGWHQLFLFRHRFSQPAVFPLY